ncbi:unnamed protein product (macronuclear) [Paramecium tetraurelia]|uniref:Uncharacterized protein n=1 Tax=Paramecium tetraurelia TaxID=5888 RepID=A0DV40_PARTE|nr:uncharacterized protein GSPATT00020569001 [Paramecium tetraurelia]CAK86907.1 unnamed protein product [Paramecium tetraurelia]|eukprot:XP_001454304.1 hypothetical protein (macronuclear) [Paramecium tetraurelia strain d4-2]
MNQQGNMYDFKIVLGRVKEKNMSVRLNYSQTKSEDYEMVIKLKVKSNIDVKTADSEFKERCKSTYTILTSFVKQIRDFLKPTFALSYHVDEQYAYITFKYANQVEQQEFMEICQFIRETMEKSQEREEVELQIESDLSFEKLGQSISNAVYQMNLEVQGKAEFQKDTVKLLENLKMCKQENLPYFLQEKYLSQILIYLQLLEKAHAEVEIDKLEYDLGFAQPSIELPFKFAIYGKLQRFAEEYLDQGIELAIKGPGLSAEIDFTYKGSLFTLIDNILIIKQ